MAYIRINHGGELELMRRLLWLKYLVILCACGSAHAAMIVDFEDWNGGSGDQTSITSRGFNFTTSNGVFFIESGGGNQWLTMRSGTLNMTKMGGGAFAVNSVDLQEGISTATQVVSITGLINNGVGAKQIIELDGVGATWQTFQLNGLPTGLGGFGDFGNVDNLLFEPYGATGQYGTSFSLDNIAIVPEPGSLSFLLLGLLTLKKLRW